MDKKNGMSFLYSIHDKKPIIAIDMTNLIQITYIENRIAAYLGGQFKIESHHYSIY